MIRIFNRQCTTSQASAHKGRPEWFDRGKLFNSITKNFSPLDDNLELNIYFDTAVTEELPEYISSHPGLPEYNIIKARHGTEAKALVGLVSHIIDQKYHDHDIIYIVEDDYNHRSGSRRALKEGMRLVQDGYITLYDHPDKYTPQYAGLTANLLYTESCHWRTTPSTTNTFACHYYTLKEDFEELLNSARGRDVSDDHGRFMALGAKGKLLLSPVPSYSAHVENGQLPPGYSKLFNALH